MKRRKLACKLETVDGEGMNLLCEGYLFFGVDGNKNHCAVQSATKKDLSVERVADMLSELLDEEHVKVLIWLLVSKHIAMDDAESEHSLN